MQRVEKVQQIGVIRNSGHEVYTQYTIFDFPREARRIHNPIGKQGRNSTDKFGDAMRSPFFIFVIFNPYIYVYIFSLSFSGLSILHPMMYVIM